MVFKLPLTTEQSWRKLNGAELVPLVRADITLSDGIRAERGADAATTRPVAKGKTTTRMGRSPLDQIHNPQHLTISLLGPVISLDLFDEVSVSGGLLAGGGFVYWWLPRVR